MELINKINTIKTNKELQEYRKQINEALNKREEFISLCEIAENNSLKSFGYIKEAFENISPDLFLTKEGKSIINKYIKTVKTNNNLSTLTTLYESIRKVNGNSDINFFLENFVDVNWNIDNKTIKEDTLKLGRILAEGILTIGNKATKLLPEEKKSLDNAIIFLSENKKNKYNIAEYSDAIKIIKEHISKNNNKNIFENINIEDLTQNLINDFNVKYSSLNEEEINIIKQISISENKEHIFNQYKTNCLNKLYDITKNSNNKENEKLNEVIEKIKNKTFIAENISTDICGFIELSKIFD